MPVWASTDATLDHNKDGVQRRHISSDCPEYLAVPQDKRCSAKGRPNTEKFQERTVRCEHPKCKALWDEIDAAKASGKKRVSKGGGKVSAAKAATTTPDKVGGQAQSLADKVKQARQKPHAKHTAKQQAAAA